MMERISLIVSFIGIIVLLVLSQFVEPKTISIKEVDETIIGQTISIYGNITSVRNFENIELLSVESLEDTSRITVVVFEKADISEGIAKITGKVKEYNNQIEIEAAEIKIG
jgi:RecJ-like exonuclease